MTYRKAKQRVRRVYSRGKSLLGGDIFKNPYVAGIVAGAIKNALTGKKIIDFEDVKNRISKVDGSNPLIFLGLGILAKNPALIAIGLYGAVDPPDTDNKEELYRYSNVGENEKAVEYSNVGENEEAVEYSNIGENEEAVEYSNIGENEKIRTKKRCVY